MYNDCWEIITNGKLHVCGFLSNDFKTKIGTFCFFRKCSSVYDILLYFLFLSWIRGVATSNEDELVHEGFNAELALKLPPGGLCIVIKWNSL